MHRRKLRKYRILKEICFTIGGCAVLAIVGATGGYGQNAMSTAEFLIETGIAGEILLISYMAYQRVQDRERRYIQLWELRRKHRQQEMKKSA